MRWRERKGERFKRKEILKCGRRRNVEIWVLGGEIHWAWNQILTLHNHGLQAFPGCTGFSRIFPVQHHMTVSSGRSVKPATPVHHQPAACRSINSPALLPTEAVFSGDFFPLFVELEGGGKVCSWDTGSLLGHCRISSSICCSLKRALIGICTSWFMDSCVAIVLFWVGLAIRPSDELSRHLHFF